MEARNVIPIRVNVKEDSVMSNTCENCDNLEVWMSQYGTPRETCKIDGHQVYKNIETCDNWKIKSVK